jgi:hypothetical protein
MTVEDNPLFGTPGHLFKRSFAGDLLICKFAPGHPFALPYGSLYGV